MKREESWSQAAYDSLLFPHDLAIMTYEELDDKTIITYTTDLE